MPNAPRPSKLHTPTTPHRHRNRSYPEKVYRSFTHLFSLHEPCAGGVWDHGPAHVHSADEGARRHRAHRCWGGLRCAAPGTRVAPSSGCLVCNQLERARVRSPWHACSTQLWVLGVQPGGRGLLCSGVGSGGRNVKGAGRGVGGQGMIWATREWAVVGSTWTTCVKGVIGWEQ